MFAKIKTRILLLAVLLVILACAVHGHGRLRVPPSRSSMWRDGYDTPPNYNDHQLFCGGFQVSFTLNIKYTCKVVFRL